MSEKSLLPYDSGHYKLVKRAITTSSMNQAIRKLYDHTIDDSMQWQVTKLKDSGYPTTLIMFITEKVLKGLSNKKKHLQSIRSIRR